MNHPAEDSYRLVSRGGLGLSCDRDGVALGDVWLVRTLPSDGLQVRPIEQLGDLLRLAYGPQPLEVVQRCHRGLKRGAAQLEAGDLVRASLEALMLGFPALPPPAFAKLAKVADLEKAGTAWQDQPRLPAGESGGGQWTTGGGGVAASPDTTAANPPRPTRAKTEGRSPLLDDGVYHPGQNAPVVTLTGGAEDESRQGIGGNEPPEDFMTLRDVFPGLKDEPGLAIPLAPIDSFLGVSGLANQANLEATTAEYQKLRAQIRALEPGWRDDEFQTIAEMSWQARVNLINNLLVQRAVAYYRFRGDIRPLQVETLRFLQNAVDRAYEDAINRYNSGRLPMRLSRGEAIGNSVDAQVRRDLIEFFKKWDVRFGPGQNIRVNNRDIASNDETYRVPDARLGKITFDWTLVRKLFSYPQVRGFFGADAEPDAVVIVRPGQLGRNSTYLIPRPAYLTPRR